MDNDASANVAKRERSNSMVNYATPTIHRSKMRARQQEDTAIAAGAAGDNKSELRPRCLVPGCQSEREAYLGGKSPALGSMQLQYCRYHQKQFSSFAHAAGSGTTGAPADEVDQGLSALADVSLSRAGLAYRRASDMSTQSSAAASPATNPLAVAMSPMTREMTSILVSMSNGDARTLSEKDNHFMLNRSPLKTFDRKRMAAGQLLSLAQIR